MGNRSHSILLIGLLLAQTGPAQNLVPNGNFEIYTQLPDSLSQLDRVVGWNNVNFIYHTIGFGSPDYYHTWGSVDPILGPMTPANGYGQVGFASIGYPPYGIFREYISAQLTAPLVPGQPYTLSFYLSNGMNGVALGKSNNIGVHLSAAPLYQAMGENINVVPQFELTSIVSLEGIWRKYTFSFTPAGAYTYITIGNFRDDVHTLTSPNINYNGCYYFIDNISLTPGATPLQITGNDSICTGDSVLLQAVNGSEYKWATSQDPSNIIDSASSIMVSPAVTTTYLLYSHTDTASFTVTVHAFPVVSLGNNTTVCPNYTLAPQGSAAMSYLWSTGATTPTIQVNQTGAYWVQASNGNCSRRDTVHIIIHPGPEVELGNDTTLCSGQVLTLQAGNAAGYIWSTGATTSSIQVTAPGTYWVDALMQVCSDSDTIIVDFASTPQINLGNDTTLCPGESLIVDAGVADSYAWSTGAITQMITVAASGYYWVTASNGSCSASDTIVVLVRQFPFLSWVTDTMLCTGDALLLDAGPADKYLWSTGATTRNIEINGPGIYQVDITYFGACVNSYSIEVGNLDCRCRFFMPGAFTPDGDGLNDLFQPLNTGGCNFITFAIFNRWGQKIFETSGSNAGWNGKWKGTDLPAGVYVWMALVNDGSQKKTFSGTVMLIR